MQNIRKLQGSTGQPPKLPGFLPKFIAYDGRRMPSSLRIAVVCLVAACGLWPAVTHATTDKTHLPKPEARPEPPQDTGFLNRKIELHGITYRFQVYLPVEWRRDDGKLWPIILFLHGRGERGSEGMWQTQIGIAEAVRNHPDRWPFVIVMPQCPLSAHWTDPAMLEMAMAALEQEASEFHGDPSRTYLTGLSMGGYGAWELAKTHPHRWAAIAIAAGGIFWGYEPDRWQQMSVLPTEYARALGHTPVWLFHGSMDPTVTPRQSQLMFDALEAAGGNVRFWLYQGVLHDCWTRAYDEPDLPRWLLAHHTPSPPDTVAEFLMIPLHPPAIKLTTAQLDSLAGQYREPNGHAVETIFRQGDQLYERMTGGAEVGLEAESADSFFRPGDTTGARTVHLSFERDAQDRVTAYVLHDNRHEERWVKVSNGGIK